MRERGLVRYAGKLPVFAPHEQARQLHGMHRRPGRAVSIRARARLVNRVVHHVSRTSIEFIGEVVSFPCQRAARIPMDVDLTTDDVDCMACIAARVVP